METVKTTRYTYADYRKLDVDDPYQYELINGELVKKSVPSPQHQMILVNLIMRVNGYVLEHKLGKVLCAPVDVFVDEYNAPQPDLLFVSTQHLSYLTADGVFGPPDLVVEIISPGSITRDRLDKLRLYARFGVPEYWIVDPKYRSVEVCQLTEVAGQPREYNVVSAVEESGAVQSKVLVGFTLDLADVFQA